MEPETVIVDVPYSIKFTNKEPIPVEELVASLLAYDRLIKRVGPFIEEAHPGVYVVDIDVLITKIEAGSITEELLVRILFKTSNVRLGACMYNYRVWLALHGRFSAFYP